MFIGWSSTNLRFLFRYEIQNGGYGRTQFNILELFRQCAVFLLDFGTVPTVWCFSIRFWNYSDSVVFLYQILELFRQCGVFVMQRFSTLRAFEYAIRNNVEILHASCFEYAIRNNVEILHTSCFEYVILTAALLEQQLLNYSINFNPSLLIELSVPDQETNGHVYMWQGFRVSLFLPLFYSILELFQHGGIYCFSFYNRIGRLFL